MTGTETLAANGGSDLLRLLVHLLPDWLENVVVAVGLTLLVAAGGRRLWRAVRAAGPAR